MSRQSILLTLLLAAVFCLASARITRSGNNFTQYGNPFADFAEDKKVGQLDCESEQADYFKVAPEFVAILTPSNLSVQYVSSCFQETEIHLNFVDDSTVEVVHTHKNASSRLCTDAYVYSNLISFKIEIYAIAGTQTTTFKVNATEMEQIKTVGIYIFRTCDKTLEFLPDLVKTIALFLGGTGLNPVIPVFGSKPTPEQTKANIKFIYEATGYQWQERPEDVVVDIDESLLNSGDFLAITRFDGLDQIVEWGSGSHAGHSTMVLKVDGETYVVESQAAWYWPRKNIQINPYKQWIEWARDCGFMVTWLPLKKEYSEQFNATAALEFFKTIEGTPYGYHNFLFGWIDTTDHSFPTILNSNVIAPLFAMVEHLDPEASSQVFTLAMNMRLNTTNLTVAQVALEAAHRNLTMPELYAQVEVDGWKYIDGVSYVCSSFVIAMYKAGGLFGSLDVNAVEFTPRDLYQLEFIDPNPVVPDNCKSVDPTNPYCQIMGQYRMEFPGIGTLAPYEHMNEQCWSQAPDYQRLPAGC